MKRLSLIVLVLSFTFTTPATAADDFSYMSGNIFIKQCKGIVTDNYNWQYKETNAICVAYVLGVLDTWGIFKEYAEEYWKTDEAGPFSCMPNEVSDIRDAILILFG